MNGRRPRSEEQWSAAGAARFARQARTEAVVHLRRSPAARAWTRQLLHNGLDRAQRIYASALVGKHSLLEPMGYPPPHRGSVEEYAERMCQDFARDLAEAELHVVSPAMSDVTVAAAHTLTTGDFLNLRDDDLPTQAGMLVLPRPLLTISGSGGLNDTRGVVWAPVTVHPPGQPAVRGVRVLTLLDTYGPVEHDTFTAALTRARLAGDPYPSLMVTNFQVMPYDWHHAPDDALLDHIHAVDRALGVETNQVAAEHGHDLAHVEGEHVVGSSIPDPDETFLRRYLFAFWRLCQQRITTIEKAPVTHSATALAHRICATPDVRIVVLRQRHHTSGHNEPDTAHPVAWTTRWTVKMHKVAQWYPTEQTHKVIWRGPYVKGPEGLPIKAVPTVNALVR